MRTALIPPALLALVATAQIGLSRGAALTPWKGGGFGMFSTLDHSGFRRVDVVVDAPGRSEALELPPSLEVDAARATAFPGDALLRRFAAGVAARERRNQRPVSRVTVVVWRTTFDRDLRSIERPIRTFVYVAPDRVVERR